MALLTKYLRKINYFICKSLALNKLQLDIILHVSLGQ